MAGFGQVHIFSTQNIYRYVKMVNLIFYNSSSSGNLRFRRYSGKFRLDSQDTLCGIPCRIHHIAHHGQEKIITML